MACYKKNFIKEAIIRIDFEKPIEELGNSIDSSLNDLILILGFTNKEVKKAFTEEIKFDGLTSDVKRSRVDFKEWNFFGNEKVKRICITKSFLFIAYHKYLSYADFAEPFLSILDTFEGAYPEAKAKRIGMRYINNVNIDDDSDPMDWQHYMQNDLLCILSVPTDKHQIRRAFQILELNFEDDDIMIKFQYGMHNPDYPSMIRKKIFVLDFDSYKTGSLSVEELKHLVPSLHSKTAELFEKAIDEKLRGVMNA